MVIGEYLFSMDVLGTVERAPAAISPKAGQLGVLTRVLYDRGATLHLLHEDYGGLARFAAAPRGSPPDPPGPHAKGAGWRVHNAVGKQALDALTFPLGSVLKNAADSRAACLRHRDTVRPRLVAVLGAP